ncbi:M12 family metallopeptidase, partial [Pontibacterium sp.]|uniref:M12 family metallopeptidase n=1 Tax=Pontibacterium sp. TaxID=2036026 RepID=UPI0035616193
MTLKAPAPTTKFLAVLGLSSALLFTSGLAVSGPHHHAASQADAAPGQQIEKAAAFTQDLIAQHRTWAQSQGAAKSQAQTNLIAKAEARREFLAELVKTNPEEALRFAIPDEKQVGMPQDVLDKLEQRVEVEGELDVFYEDYEDGSHILRSFVKTSFGERFELHPVGNTKEMQSGKKVRINGLLLGTDGESASTDGNIVVAEGEENILMLEAGSSTTGGSNGGTPEPVANTFGEQRVAVFLVNFADNPSDKPWTKDEVMNVIAGQVNDFIQENSFQQTWLTVDVYGWYTAPHSSTVCDTKSIGDTGRDGAAAEGADLSSYDRIISVHPPTAACKWSGVGSVGGAPSTTVNNGSLTHGTISHELGHNFGLYHSHALYCNGESLSSNCSHIEYGNIPDIMGQMVPGHYNAYQKERLGWLGYGSSPAITTVDAAGTYTIAPYAAQDNGPKAL